MRRLQHGRRKPRDGVCTASSAQPESDLESVRALQASFHEGNFQALKHPSWRPRFRAGAELTTTSTLCAVPSSHRRPNSSVSEADPSEDVVKCTQLMIDRKFGESEIRDDILVFSQPNMDIYVKKLAIFTK